MALLKNESHEPISPTEVNYNMAEKLANGCAIAKGFFVNQSENFHDKMKNMSECNKKNKHIPLAKVGTITGEIKELTPCEQ